MHCIHITFKLLLEFANAEKITYMTLSNPSSYGFSRVSTGPRDLVKSNSPMVSGAVKLGSMDLFVALSSVVNDLSVDWDDEGGTAD